jgi:hypothetical protein
MPGEIKWLHKDFPNADQLPAETSMRNQTSPSNEPKPDRKKVTA